MKYKNGTLILSSGKTIDLIDGVVGLDLDHLDKPDSCRYVIRTWDNEFIDGSKFTPEEKIEFANFMLCKWLAYKNAAEKAIAK